MLNNLETINNSVVFAISNRRNSERCCSVIFTVWSLYIFMVLSAINFVCMTDAHFKRCAIGSWLCLERICCILIT